MGSVSLAAYFRRTATISLINVGEIQTTVVRYPASAAGFDREKPQDRPPGTS